jgi:DNA polymerase
MSGELEQIAKEISTCTKCPLHKNRTNAVPGEGDYNAKLLFIGEAPGYHEDIQGRPFVGQSGQLLGHLLTAIKLKREEVYITNVVKCRPPDNRDPAPVEIETCKPYLDRQIAAMDPRVIVTLGRFSMARWFAGQRISQVHGKPKTEGGRIIMPMFHPAAALRDRTGPTMRSFKEDGLTIPDLLKQAEEMAATQLWGSINEVAIKPIEESLSVPVIEPVQPVGEIAEAVSIPTVEALPKERKPKKVTSKAIAEVKAEYVATDTTTSLIPPAQETESEKKKPARTPRKKKNADEEEKIVVQQLSLF